MATTQSAKPDLSAFSITRKWPARHPDRIQLYSLPTPNGVKVSIALEELGLPYEPHLVSFETNDQTSPEFLSLNPNNKSPAILDPNGPDGQPLALFEPGASGWPPGPLGSTMAGILPFGLSDLNSGVLLSSFMMSTRCGS
eukprot:gene33786-38183_t